MVSPHLTKKKNETLTVALGTRKLFQTVYREQNKEVAENEGEAKIKVSALISKVAFYYEKIRNYVDYNEEHLHRKNAVARILKRQVVIEGAIKLANTEEASRNLLTELIRAGYLANDKISEGKIDEVKAILEKHLRLRELAMPHGITAQVAKLVTKEKRELGDWLIGIAASEIESILEIDRAKEMVISNMYEYLVKLIKLPVNFAVYEKDLPIQIYLSIYRTYLKFDRSMLSFILFKYYNSDWWNPTEETTAKIAASILPLRAAIEQQLDHPLVKQLDKITNKYTVFYSILTDMIKEDPAGLYETIKNKPQVFSDLVKSNFQKKFNQTKARLWRAGINSIIYIFLTKTIFAVLLEVPATKYLGEPLNFYSLAVNILFPPFLLLVAIMFTRVSSDENNKRVVSGVEEITFEEKNRREPIILRKPASRNSAISFIFSLLYSLTFLISFGAVIWILDKIHFTWVSITIFLFFLAFVSFFTIRIRKSVQQLIVVEEKENLVNFVLDFFFIPIAAVGKWLSQKFSKINVFIFIMDFVIEAPFKVFVEIAEQWTRYVRERKEDIE
ncbi:MAG TPA: hypothetical protein VMC41_00580 [Candidatus Nanoarchaeia archaeon]|nr:hypothetical protein [Candidatus Nanoarchaeia archaeon]